MRVRGQTGIDTYSRSGKQYWEITADFDILPFAPKLQQQRKKLRIEPRKKVGAFWCCCLPSPGRAIGGFSFRVNRFSTVVVSLRNIGTAVLGERRKLSVNYASSNKPTALCFWLLASEQSSLVQTHRPDPPRCCDTTHVAELSLLHLSHGTNTRTRVGAVFPACICNADLDGVVGIRVRTVPRPQSRKYSRFLQPTTRSVWNRSDEASEYLERECNCFYQRSCCSDFI